MDLILDEANVKEITFLHPEDAYRLAYNGEWQLSVRKGELLYALHNTPPVVEMISGIMERRLS